MHDGWPTWPSTPPRHGGVVLREFRDTDLLMALELSRDPYVPLVTTLPADATPRDAAAWIVRQRARLAEGRGFSFAIADAWSGCALGQIGLWLAGLSQGRATAGYLVAPSARRRGVAGAALTALTAFAWTIAALHRVELHIEPCNTGSVRTAEKAGYRREGLMRSHHEIGGTRRDMLLYAAVRGG
jgi:[ribosomal protein S5]-alanine N-acetyltransferase